ncbi:MAG: hypothetical protein QXM93_03045 [Candidatus Methanomethyliaceae archaeon]
MFAFEILTGLNNEDLLDELCYSKKIKKEMTIKVLAFKPEDYYDE